MTSESITVDEFICRRCYQPFIPDIQRLRGICVVCEQKSQAWKPYFSDVTDQKERVRLALAADDFEFFVKAYYGFILAPFQKEVVSVMQDPRIDRALIEIPRGHGKSTLAAELYVAWKMAFNPNAYIIILSATADQAIERAENIKKNFEDYPFSLLRRPSQKKWGRFLFSTMNGAVCRVGGAGKQLAGVRQGKHRPGLIICDDVVPYDKATLTDPQVEGWFFDIVSNLGDRNTKIVVVGTPYRMTDLMATLKENERYKGEKGKILRFEALMGRDIDVLDEEEVEVLWDAEIPLSTLKEKREEVGGLVFSRNYLCRVISEGSSLFPWKYIEACSRDDIDFVSTRKFDEATGSPIDYDSVIVGVDLAISAEVSADFFVAVVIGITPTGRFRLLWLERHKGLPYRKQKELLKDIHNRYLVDLFIIESNSYQHVLTQELEETTVLPVMSYKTGIEKHDFERGVPVIRKHLENKRYIFPTMEKSVQLDIMFLELQSWVVNAEGKVINNGKHDDTSMALWLATVGAERSASPFVIVGSVPEPTEAIEQLATDRSFNFSKHS